MSAIREGQFFLLPVESGQYGVGLVARAPRRGGILLGYFFGPRRTQRPDTDWLVARAASQAVYVARFRDAALYRGEWPTLHVLTDFERTAWPVPAFHRFDGAVTVTPGASPVTDWRVEYGDDNLIMPRDERPATRADYRLPDDVVHDAGLLCREVASRLVAAVPSADDAVWR